MVKKIALLFLIIIPFFIFSEEHIRWYNSHIDTTYGPLPNKITHLYSWTRVFELPGYQPESLYVRGRAKRYYNTVPQILMDREKWQWAGVAEICSVGIVTSHWDTVYTKWVEEGFHQVVFISPLVRIAHLLNILTMRC